MHLIDQELSGINQYGSIVVSAISGYVCNQFGQLCQILANYLWPAKLDMATMHRNIYLKKTA